jgi:WD40 repeat protein
MRRLATVLWLAAFVLGPLAPAQQTAKPAPLPPINPAAARLAQTITGLDGPGFAIAYSETRQALVAACDRDTIRIWKKDVLLNIRPGSGSGNALRGHKGSVLALAWHEGPLVSAGIDRKINVWDFNDGKILNTISTTHLVRNLALSPDNKFIAMAGDDPMVQVWDIGGKEAIKLTDHNEWVTSLTYSPDGKLLASGDFAGKVCLWDMPGGKKLRNLPAPPMPPPKEPPDPTPATALAFSPDNKTLALGQGIGTILLVNPADGKVLRPLPGHTSAVTSLVWHPSGTLLVSSSRDRTVRLWNPANGQLIKSLEGHTAWVEGVTFYFHGTHLASVSADQTVRLWDLTDPPKK